MGVAEGCHCCRWGRRFGDWVLVPLQGGCCCKISMTVCNCDLTAAGYVWLSVFWACAQVPLERWRCRLLLPNISDYLNFGACLLISLQGGAATYKYKIRVIIKNLCHVYLFFFANIYFNLYIDIYIKNRL